MCRDNVISFRVSDKEFKELKEKSKNIGRSAYIRSQIFRNELTTNELAHVIMSYIGKKLAEAELNPDKKIWTEHKLKKLKKRLKKPLSIDFEGMSGEEKAKFERHFSKKREAFSQINSEIESILKKFYVE